MNAIKFLYAAYIATWLIHALYLGSLVRRYKSLQKQLKELGKSGK
jgi:CcmD family protein